MTITRSESMESVFEIFLKKYKGYTPIQEKAIEVIKNKENCIIIAPTGAGKTEAAVLALLDRITKNENSAGIQLIYITPLRALNRDMIKRLEQLCAAIGVTIAVRHGDTLQSERAKQVRKPPQVLITTPETLQSILPTKTLGLALRNVFAVVVDEIHELYHSKRGAQLSLALERLEELAPNFQRIGVSATVGNAELITKFLCSFRSARVVSVDNRKEMKLAVQLPRTHEKEMETVSQRFALDDDALARLNAITDNIKGSKSTIIFANTRQIVEALGSRLVYINSIYPFGGIGVHHSSLDKMARIELENEFKEGRVKSIIATSSLELGIDIGSVDLVMQYGSPRQTVRLIQRAGRSGHTLKATSKGTIVALNTMDAIEAIAICDGVAKNDIESFRPHFNALDVLANQVSAIALDKGIIPIEGLLAIVNRSYVYKDFSKDQLVVLLEFMNKQRMVGFDGKNITSGMKTRMYYYDHLSVIPDSKRFVVKNIADNRIISSLDENFVSSSIDENSIFITKGLPWKVISIDADTITVEPSTDLEAAVPDWSGEDIPVSRNVAESVFRMIGKAEPIPREYSDEKLNEEIRKLISDQEKFALPREKELLVEQGDEYTIVYTGLGTLANEALSRLLAARFTSAHGKSVNMKVSPYMIFFEISGGTDMPKIIRQVSERPVEAQLSEVLSDSEIFRYRFVTVAKLFGIIDREATLSKSISKRIMKVLHGTPVYQETARELMNNYFDTAAVSSLLGEISAGKVKIRSIRSSSLSALAKAVLNSAYYTKELMMPLLPSNELIESFTKYVLSKSIKLVCTHCGVQFSRKLTEIKDRSENEIVCPNCGSPMLAPFKESYAEVIEKRKQGKRLGPIEHETLKEILKQASLISSYGGKGAIALSTYGIGPQSAARILMMLRRHDKLFFMDLIDAQKQFIKNRKYWSI